METIVDLLDKDRELTPNDMPNLERILGYKIEAPQSFFDDPDEEHTFRDLLEVVLVEQGKAVWIDARKWQPGELFEQLAAIYPQLGIKLVSSRIDTEDPSAVVAHVQYEIDGETKVETIGYDDSINDWMAKLNIELLEKTGTQLIYVAAEDEDLKWLLAQKDFSEDEFNAAISK